MDLAQQEKAPQPEGWSSIEHDLAPYAVYDEILTFSKLSNELLRVCQQGNSVASKSSLMLSYFMV